jgi:hypothetical protein
MSSRFFSRFHDRLVLQLGRIDIDRELVGSTELMRLREYTRNEISCQV